MTAQDHDVFFVGHSLSDAIPEMLVSFGADSGPDFTYTYQQIIGAPLRWQWSCINLPGRWPGDFPDGHVYPFYHPEEGLISGKYEYLILNEGVPRHDNEWGIGETQLYVDSFYRYATEYRPDIQVFICELWHCIESGTPTGCDYDIDTRPWRQRLDDDLPMWEKAVDFLNEKYQPSQPVRLIPSGQALAMLYDSIEAGHIAGVHSIDDVFLDRIHGNDTVRYLVACVNYASLTGESPVGLTNEPKTWWGGDYGEIPPLLANQLQRIAWEAVCRYPKNEVNCETTLIDPREKESDVLKIFPNPTEATLSVNSHSDGELQLIDLNGQMVLSKLVSSGVSQLRLPGEAGTYILQFIDGDKIEIHKVIVQ